MCYDVTVIAPGCVNGEYKKTSGHYHGWNASHTHTFGEVYEVISGTAMYVLQKSPDFDKHPESPEITDIIFVTVHEGETLLVPPDYGHCSVNIGTTPLVFSNVAYTPAPVIYDSVRAHRGMAYYVMEDRGGVSTVQNPRYDLVSLPRPKYATVHEDPSLGSDFSVPAYLNFMERPESYGHLPNPDPYIDRIMDLLDFE
jgi:glucose-6-phosphate isomerase